MTKDRSKLLENIFFACLMLTCLIVCSKASCEFQKFMVKKWATEAILEHESKGK